jgi:aminoglycoside phosphotransferase (APT) family kinase protein
VLSAKCVDRRLSVLDQQIDDLLCTNILTGLLAEDDRRRLALRRGELHAAIAKLARIDIPETLLHGDLHPNNIAVTDGRAVAFDWTDAALGHPFLDLVTFFGGGSPITGNPLLAGQLKAAYIGEWAEFGSADHLRSALGLAEELAPVHQAVSYLHLTDHLTGPSQEAMARGGTFWLRTIATGRREP